MIPLLLGLGVLIGGAIIVANWDDIVDWLKDFIPKLKAAWNKLKKAVAHAAMVVAEKVKNMFHIKHKQYYQENGQWMEETTTRKVNEDEVPAFIKAKVKKSQQDVNITSEMEQELHMEI